MKKAMPAGRQGFTLVELLVTISIIATLTAILLPNFMGARQKATDSQKIQDMTSIKNALRMYYNDNQNYPLGSGITNVQSLLAKYMTDTGVGYTYYQTNTGDGFQLCTYLDSGQGDDDVNSQTRCGAPKVSVCGLGVGTTMDKLYVVCAN
jgi:prepilin-type N-terminal cleavage/methylation domain-containing protein